MCFHGKALASMVMLSGYNLQYMIYKNTNKEHSVHNNTHTCTHMEAQRLTRWSRILKLMMPRITRAGRKA